MPKNKQRLKYNNKLSARETRQSFALLSVGISLLHLFFFIFFLFNSYTVMAVYNFITVFIYILCCVLVFRYQFTVAVTLTLFEILIQTILSSYFLGNSWGFYLYNFIAIIPAIFQSNQEDLLTPKKFGKLYFLIIMDMISFYIAYYISLTHEPVYKISANQDRFLFLVNSVVSFLSLMVIGYMVIKSAFSIAKSTLIDNKRLNSMASTDHLTGLLNRRSMGDKLSALYQRFEKEGSPFSVLMLDVDFFKKINDTYGHATGDKVLINISNIIKEGLRYGDSGSRWGGEEFLIALSEVGKGEALSVAERIRIAIANTPTILEDETVIECKVTIGVATIRSGVGIEELISEADKKLYLGKKSGRNRVVV